MNRAGVLTLIADGPRGVFDKRGETSRDVFCTIKSVSYKEFYEALNNGITPSFVFVLADYAEYANEKVCVFEGERYRVVRSYITPRQTVELTAERVTVDA